MQLLWMVYSAMVFIAAVTASMANFKGNMDVITSGWPQCDPKVKQMSGYFNINSTTNKNYFFWAFESKKNPNMDPVLLWLTGGPGCSSSLALLVENGPCHINETSGDLYLNPYSWNNLATVIYIDQPAGVGFSYSDAGGMDHDEKEVAHDMYYFMQAFYRKYPKFRKNELFIYGESYGGHYAPAVAHRIWRGNNNHEGPYIPLVGLSIGNGLTDPSIQYKYYSELAYKWCMTVKGKPCVSSSVYEQMKQSIDPCISLINECNLPPYDPSKCINAYDYCNQALLNPYQQTGLNVYDIRISCNGPLCYNLDMVTRFMNRLDVKKALGVKKNIRWETCNNGVNRMFTADWMHDLQTKIPDLLDSGIRVLIYAGDDDFICNWLGNKAWTLQLKWKMNSIFTNAADRPWYVATKPAGQFRTVSSNTTKMLFTFLQIHGAGHLVPMNQPERALDMVRHFLNDELFYGITGP